ncbi:hypothetical protein HHI36_023808 [Cryptolaemus montrouzieri]|uniref:Uncharacterized protein n=1 Tax=Cryptolaemus montrouzieri TaxID=559131 RepID=A0ABD2PHP1_9CUCU
MVGPPPFCLSSPSLFAYHPPPLLPHHPPLFAYHPPPLLPIIPLLFCLSSPSSFAYHPPPLLPIIPLLFCLSSPSSFAYHPPPFCLSSPSSFAYHPPPLLPIIPLLFLPIIPLLFCLSSPSSFAYHPPSRNENETPRECGTIRRDRPSSLCSRETNFYFHYAFRFSVIPMTRAHARLLGPCFKTGPEITQSYSVADRRFEEVCPRTPRRTAATGRDRHQVRSSTRRTSLPRAGRELKSRPPPSVNRRASRSDNRVSESDGEPRSRATLRTVDRHPTDRDVLLGRSARVRNRLVTRRAQATRTSPVTPTRHSDDSVRD